MSKKRRDQLLFWGFLSPVLIAFTITVIIPFFMGIFYTFTDWNGVSKNIQFVGIENYISMFKDKEFGHSFVITVIYTIINVVLMNGIGFLLAFLVTRQLKTRNLLRTGFFLPNLIGGLILGFIWQFIFNSAVTSVGKMAGVDFLSTSLLGETKTAIIAMTLVANWQYAGYLMVIYVAALQNIPEELIEAAKIDGANGWQRLKHIMIPMVMPAVTINLFLALSNSFKVYDLNLSLTNGGPGNSTEMLSMHIYKEAFILNNMGIGQAKAVFFFIIVAIIAIVQVYFSKKREVEL
ncbi:MAG: carbohydrate ABC transporter permease [Bacillaceae bacterium]